MNNRFWLATLLATVLCGGTLQVINVGLMGWPAPKPRLAIPGYEYISATRDGQTDHSLFYFNLFGFGDRIKAADVLVLGSSHAQFGISAALLADATSTESNNRRGFNVALGGGEGLAFAALLIERNRSERDLIVFDPFTNESGLSTEATRTIALSGVGSAYLATFKIWSGFIRDWALQGFLPRLTIAAALKIENPVGSTVVRDWLTADVTAVYSNHGEIFKDQTKGHAIGTGPDWPGERPILSDLTTIKSAAARIFVTAIPYPSFSEQIARETAAAINAKFVHISAGSVLFWDYHHLNQAGRERATDQLLNVIGRRRATAP